MSHRIEMLVLAADIACICLVAYDLYRAAGKIRQQVTGVDYTRGGTDDMISMAGKDMAQDVLRETLRVSPVPDSQEQSEADQLSDSWKDMDDGVSGMVFYTFQRGRFTLTCNDQFRRTFVTGKEIEEGYQQASIMPSVYLSK